MKLLIGVCTQNRNNLLKKNLYSINKLNIPKFVDPIIVIVDSSKNSLSKTIISKFKKKKSFKKRVIYSAVKRRGIPIARNEILKIAKKINPKFLCFFDDDCTVSKIWLVNNLKIFKETNCDVITGPQLHQYNSAKKNFFNFLEILERSVKHKSVVSWAATNNVIFRFSIVKKLNIKFDEKMTLMGGSDQLFFKTISSKGYKIIWNEKSKVHEHFHEERNNFKWFKKRNLRYGLSGVYIDKKIYGTYFGSIISLLKLLAYLVFSICYFFLQIIRKIFFYKSSMFFYRALGKILGLLKVKSKKYV